MEYILFTRLIYSEDLPCMFVYVHCYDVTGKECGAPQCAANLFPHLFTAGIMLHLLICVIGVHDQIYLWLVQMINWLLGRLTLHCEFGAP